MIIRPENPISPLIATLRVSGEAITVVLQARDERMVRIAMRLGYRWNGAAWERRIVPQFNGAVTERAAELGHELLCAGFIVSFPDEVLARQAAAGEFEDETRRWVKVRTHEPHQGWFSIEWPRHEDFYHQARRIPGSRYRRPFVIAPPDAYLEVLDFAEQHGFAVSEKAQQAAKAAEQRHEEQVLFVAVKPRKKKSSEKTKKPAEKPSESVASHLLDEDDVDCDN